MIFLKNSTFVEVAFDDIFFLGDGQSYQTALQYNFEAF